MARHRIDRQRAASSAFRTSVIATAAGTATTSITHMSSVKCSGVTMTALVQPSRSWPPLQPVTKH